MWDPATFLTVFIRRHISLRKITEPNHDFGYLPVEDRTVPAVDNTVKQEGSRLVSEAGTEGGR